MEEMDDISVVDLEKMKIPHGEITLVGLGRLGFRTALQLMQVHRGGPKRITAIDGQKISADDHVFRMMGGSVGDFKVKFFENLSGPGFSREIIGIPINISPFNLDLITGDVVCIMIAGGDTLPVTAGIIRYAQASGAKTISTMGVFGVGDEPVTAVGIGEADPENPIVSALRDHGIRDHLLVGTGKLIRDWEPVTPAIIEQVSRKIAAEALRLLANRK